jgi:hypothetical protein
MANSRNSYARQSFGHALTAKAQARSALSTLCPPPRGRGGSPIWTNEESASRWNGLDKLGWGVSNITPFADLFSPPYPPFAFAGKS